MSVRLVVTIVLTAVLARGSGIDVEPIHPARGSPVINRIVQTGDYHGAEMRITNGTKMLGLFRGASGYWVGLVPVRVRSTEDIVLGDLSGKRVFVDGKRKPIFLLKDFDRLANRTVPTSFDGELDFSPTQRLSLHLGRHEFVLAANPNGKWLKLESGEKFEICQLYLERGDEKFVLPLTLASGTYSGVALQWAGDLDGDGKPDFLFVEYGFNWRATRLFLSTAAKPGEPVAEVAFHYATGC